MAYDKNLKESEISSSQPEKVPLINKDAHNF